MYVNVTSGQLDNSKTITCLLKKVAVYSVVLIWCLSCEFNVKKFSHQVFWESNQSISKPINLKIDFQFLVTIA